MYIKHTDSQICYINRHITSFLKGEDRLIRRGGGVRNMYNFYFNYQFGNKPYIVLYVLPEKVGGPAPSQ